MASNSTPIFNAGNKSRRRFPQPSEATLEVLRNFARTYVPESEPSGKMKAVLFN